VLLQIARLPRAPVTVLFEFTVQPLLGGILVPYMPASS
jgi:hypothetical protein